jgi:hypothetical protein
MSLKESEVKAVQKTKRQHTVPRFYLKRFCKNCKQLFVFDKSTRKSFRAQVENVALESYFYDIPEDLITKACPGQDINNQFIEKAFSNMESVVTPLFGEVIANANKLHAISRDHRLMLAPYIIVQLLRTKLERDRILETNEKLMQAIADMLVRKNFPDLPEDHFPRIEYNQEVLPIIQAQHIFDEDLIVEFASMINRHIWFIGINKTIQPYYTSDHPVVQKANVQISGRSFNGLRSPGIEIAFPLSSRHILVLLERSYFQRMAWADGKVMKMDPIGVDYFNSLQVQKSHRQVFCEVNEFEQALGVCRRYPEVCSPDRPKMRVVQTEDVIGILSEG